MSSPDADVVQPRGESQFRMSFPLASQLREDNNSSVDPQQRILVSDLLDEPLGNLDDTALAGNPSSSTMIAGPAVARPPPARHQDLDGSSDVWPIFVLNRSLNSLRTCSLSEFRERLSTKMGQSVCLSVCLSLEQPAPELAPDPYRQEGPAV